MRVRAKENYPALHPALTPGNVYRVFTLGPEHFGVIDDLGAPSFFTKDQFDLVDASEPSDWVTYEWSEPGRRDAGPASFYRYLFDDMENGDKRARLIFHQRICKWLHGED